MDSSEPQIGSFSDTQTTSSEPPAKAGAQYSDSDLAALGPGPGDTSSSSSEHSNPPGGRRIPRRRRRGGEIYGESMPDPSQINTSSLPVYPKSDELFNQLKTIAQKNPLFRYVDASQLDVLIKAMFKKSYKSGEDIIVQGDQGDNFYILDEGTVDIYIKQPDGSQLCVVSLEKGGAFGELALMYNKSRAATVRASSDCLCWAIDRNTYRTILLATTMEKRDLYTKALSKVPILGSLTPYERDTISDALTEHSFKTGEIIVKQGDIGDAFYIITSGSCDVHKDIDGESILVGHLKEWSFFGEIALLKPGDRRAATVSASEDCTVVSLDRDSFHRVLGSVTEVLRRNITQYKLYIDDGTPTPEDSPKPVRAATSTETETESST